MLTSPEASFVNWRRRSPGIPASDNRHRPQTGASLAKKLKNLWTAAHVKNPREAVGWRARGCGNEAAHGQGWDEGTTGDVLAATEPMEEFHEDAVAIIREFMEDAWQIARHPSTKGR
jgi:hypothetical protein